MVASRSSPTRPVEALVAGATAPPRGEPASAVAAMPHPSRSVARGALALLSTQPVTWASSLLVAVCLPRYLGDARLGQYAVLLVIGMFVALFAQLGVPEYVVRRVATRPEGALRDGGAAMILVLMTSTLLMLVLTPVLPRLGVLGVDSTLLGLALAATVLASGQAMVLALLRAQERHARFAWVNAGATFIGACSGVIVLVISRSLLLYVATGAATSAILLVVSWRLSGFHLSRAALDRRLLAELVRGGLPFVAKNAAMQIRGDIDRIMLVVLASAPVIGWYAAAFRIIAVPVFIPTLITVPLLPVLSRLVNDRPKFDRTLRHGAISVTLLTVPVCAMIFALAPSIPALLGWPEEFRQAVPLMMLLVLQQPLIALNMVLGTGLVALTKERTLARVVAVAAVLSPALNLVLIPVFEREFGNGAIGSALAQLGVESVMLAGIVAMLPRGSLDRATAGRMLTVVLAGGCLGATVMALAPLALLPAVALGGAAFVAAGLALRVLKPSDLRQLRGTLRPGLAIPRAESGT